jgi:hypothetical protein
MCSIYRGSGFSPAAGQKNGRSNRKRNIMIHRRVRRERRESPNTIKEIILNNLCDLCVLCGEIFLENGIGFYGVSYKGFKINPAADRLQSA